MADNRKVARRHVRQWAEELVDLTRRNRLLYFKHTASASLGFEQSAKAVAKGLDGRGGWGFFLPKPPPEDPDGVYDPGEAASDELVTEMKPQRYGPKIERGLKNLARKTQAEFLDAGLWVLYLGLGELVWTDVDEKEASSPLMLVPVELQQVGGQKEWRMSRTDNGEPALNPALAVKLEKDFGIVLPTLEELEEPDLDHVLDAVKTAIEGTTWKVRTTSVLTTFTFQKEVIYRDLRDNEDEIVEHSMVRLLAEGPSSEVAVDLDFAPENEDRLDDRHPPEDLLCVLDADSTQRQCLIAARGDRSFVMDGPPGTGKSQTITNVIAQLMADGKTVLFVSEKAAALEVVQNRLEALKLDPFVLALHSRTATRKAVAQELGRALEERPKAREKFDASDRARLAANRKKLTSYAAAVNQRREPLGWTLHDAIGRISQLDDLPDVPVPAVDTSTLTPEEFAHLVDTASQLGRAWGPVSRGDAFLWRDLRDPKPGAARDADLRRRITAAQDSLGSLEAIVENVCDELGLRNGYSPLSCGELTELLDVVDERLPVDPSILTTRDFEGVIGDLQGLSDAIEARHRIVSQLDDLSPKWGEVDADAADRLRALADNSTSMEPALTVADSTTSDALERASASTGVAANALEAMLEPLGVLAEVFGYRGSQTVAAATRLIGLSKLAGSTTPPEPTWLNPVYRNALTEARSVLSDLLSTYRARRDALATVFTPAVLELDLQALRTRFTDVHTGLSKLGGAYRADKKILAAATVSGKASSAVIAKLDEAVEWKDLSERLSRAENQHAGLLGERYYGDRDGADLDAIERAVAHADDALRLAAGDVDASSLIQQIAAGAQPDERLPRAAESVEAALESVRGSWPFDEFADADRLEDLTVEQLLAWLREAESLQNQLAEEVGAIDEATDASSGLARARTLARRRAGYEKLTADIDERRTSLTPFVGDHGPALTDPAAISELVGWVTSMRDALGGPAKKRVATALLRTELTSAGLQDAVESTRKTAAAVFDEFEDSYGSELRSEFLSSFDEARDLLEQMLATSAEIEEWDTHCASRDELASAGWRAVVDACVDGRVEADHVAPLIERSVLQRWVDQVFDDDSNLSPRRSIDRDTLQEEFQRLDRAMTADVAARVINACSDRRPRSLAGQAGVIRQQAQLKRRHKPVRRLLSEAGEAVQMLKPCFMMSPLSVSQFVPPGVRFDVVIFDEASQVREADAICCVYRGNQLIVAGDPKQLPPTSFFDSVVDSEEEDIDEEDLLDFESVLDRCKAQGFPSLPLNWHYRSRHESLITFSNRSFYEGRLHTFPGAVFDSPDLGVELFVVDGQYQRGGTRDNPIEAEAVVDRILHHQREHPELTLGVVTLSSAQQSTIEAAVERRSSSEPALRELVSDDRLDGFFVKNLENVQGDERDIIILSIGYGPDEVGKFTMNFGPMNRSGGERRLNVAVTRARRRVEAVASFSPGKIDTTNPTILHLKRYLDYADRGIGALALELGDEDRDVDSPFEAEVLSSIQSLGYDAQPQVGVAGYRIDIGVKHPKEPGSFVLGVECDGASYHSAKVARDRDRLRQQVLEGLGWRIHRIWSTAWFTDRSGEVDRLRSVIEDQLSGRKPERTEPAPSIDDVDVIVEQHDFDDHPEWVYVYEPPVLPAYRSSVDFHDPNARGAITRQIASVVNDAGPVHQTVVLDTLRAAWGLGRSGSRIRNAFEGAVRHLVSNGTIERVGEILQTPGQEIWVRGPSEEEEAPRKVKVVPDAELELAVVNLLRDAGTSSYEDIRLHWARLFGWRRIGSEIEAVFEDVVDSLIEQGVVDGPDPLRLRS